MTRIALLEGHEAHAEPGHPERPARLAGIAAAIARTPALRALNRVGGKSASRDALERIHDPAYLDRLDALCEIGGGHVDHDTYVTSASCAVARQSCGNLLAVVDDVLADGGSGFALGRPPGHHARPSQAMGFCLLSNVAVAARHAQAVWGVERVLIIDLDAHHGNGTQEAFWDDPDVFVLSSHQAGIFPGTGAFAETGGGAGEGATLNLPLPAGTGDEIVGLYQDVLPAVAERHRPDLVLMSFGSDAHWLDPLAGLAVSTTGLADTVGVIQQVADAHCEGRLGLTLEGGYHIDVLATSVAAVLERLLDPAAEIEDPFGPTSRPPVDLSGLAETVRQRLARH